MHCSKGVQPVPEAVSRSGCRDKRNCQQCDSNLGPLTPQSDELTTLPLRAELSVKGKLAHTRLPSVEFRS